MEAKITEDDFIEFMTMDFPSFKVTKCNLAYPTSDFVISFYTLIIEAFTNLDNTDQLWNLTEEQCACIKANQNEGASFIQHIYSLNLHAAVKYIFSQVNQNVPGFSYSDIILPENTPRRTFVLMSFMLNCFYYYVTFCEELNEDMIACENKVQEIREKRELKSKLLNQLKEYEDQKAERAESLKNIKASMLNYASSNKEKENILKELHTKLNLINAELSKVEERESHNQDELIRLEDSIKHFESLIVANPNEAAEIHANNEMKKFECKNKMKNLEEQVRISSGQLSRFNTVRELQQMLNSIIQRHEDYSGNISKMDFKELQNCINGLNVKLSNLKVSESKFMAQFIEKELLIPKLKSECAQYESEQAAIICKGEERCRIYNEYIENQEKLYTQMSIKMRKDAEEVDDINTLTAELNKKCSDVKEKIKLMDNENKEQYLWCINEIKNAFISVHQALTN